MQRVLVSVTTGGNVRHELAANLTVWQRGTPHDVTIEFHNHRPYEHALNLIAKRATSEGYDWWLQLDDDQCPMRNPLELIDHDKDVIGCPAPIWKPDVGVKSPLVWNVFADKPEGFKTNSVPCEGLQPVDITGSGALLIARRVFSAIENPFGCEWDHGLKAAGPDIAFCRRVKDAGFQVWVHFGYPCNHWNVIDLTELAFWLARRNNSGDSDGEKPNS